MDVASATLLGQTPTIEIRPAAKTPAAPASASDGTNARPDFWHRTFGKDGFSFSTILDIVNPLQHIPIVSTIYQKLTGDVASPGANIIGGALFGGPIGLAVASADTALKSETGKDMGGHVFALFDSGAPATQPTTMLAEAGSSISAPAIATDDTEPQQILADTPKLTVPNELSQSKAPIKDTHLAAANPALLIKTTTPFPFVMNNRRTPANGVGGSFVPLESRASIAPAATLASEPIATAAKLVAKADGKASVSAPDLKTLAANPDLVNQLRLNGMRPHAAKPGFDVPKPNASNPPAMPTAVASTTSTPSSSLDPTASGEINTGGTSGDEGNSDGYASLMARNLARYMALQNKHSTPAKVNQAF